MPRTPLPPDMRRSKAQRNKGKGVLVHKRVLSPQADAYRTALTLLGYNRPGVFVPYPKKGTAAYRRVKRIAAALGKLRFAQDPAYKVLANPYLITQISEHLTAEDMHALTRVNRAALATRHADAPNAPVAGLYREKETQKLKVVTDWLNGLPRRARLSPEEVERLTELWVDNNLITSLPPEIGRLSNLTKLVLLTNKLTSLPDSIGRLTKLKELNVSYNELTSLPDSIGQLTDLRELNMLSNNLTSLPDSIGRLTKLKELNVSYNPLNAASRTLVAQMKASNPNLRVLLNK